MNLYTFIFATVAFTIQQYADYYKESDLQKTLEELKKDYGLPRIRKWDYIVVGGGSAGCILAEQLSQKHTVLLLEKGGDPVPETYNKEDIDEVYTHPGINDLYTSWPQKNAFGSHNWVETISVGRMLGGSGSHNTMVYNRGSPKDYDNWAKLTGDPALGYENMQKHFKAVENYKAQPSIFQNESGSHGQNGAVYITSDIGPDFPLWSAAAKELGYKVTGPNTHQSISFLPPNFNFRKGLRHSSYVAFIQERARNRPTLTIQRYSVVQNVLFHKNKTAYGVAYLRHGIPQVAHARKEIILSAGAIGSASLLIKSGVGPKELLKEAGIPIVSNVPGVGATYMDHPAVFLNFQVTNATSSSQWFDSIEPQYGVEESLQKFHNNGDHRNGLFTKGLIIRSQAFLVSQRAKARGESEWADYLVFLMRNKLPVKPNLPVVTFLTWLGRPSSVGKLMFNTSLFKEGEREDTKLIRPYENFFGDPTDLDVLLEGVNMAIKFKDTQPFKPLGLKVADETPEQCKGLKYGSNEYWKCFIVYMKTDRYNVDHRSSTCRMGNLKENKLAVVDSKFRVRGVKGLRVADTSVFPTIPNANTNAPVMVMAMKASSDILGDA